MVLFHQDFTLSIKVSNSWFKERLKLGWNLIFLVLKKLCRDSRFPPKEEPIKSQCDRNSL